MNIYANINANINIQKQTYMYILKIYVDRYINLGQRLIEICVRVRVNVSSSPCTHVYA